MHSRHTLLVVSALALAACSNDSNEAGNAFIAPAFAAANAQAPSTPHQAAAARSDVVWGPAPSVFPPGAQFAVMQGDPSKAGEEFTVRLRLPSGYKLPPHTHPTVENVTVLEGTFLAGMGTTFDESAMKPIEREGFASIPADAPHYAMARGITVVQVHAIGPFALTYVNPADAPAAR